MKGSTILKQLRQYNVKRLPPSNNSQIENCDGNDSEGNKFRNQIERIANSNSKSNLAWNAKSDYNLQILPKMDLVSMIQSSLNENCNTCKSVDGDKFWNDVDNLGALNFSGYHLANLDKYKVREGQVPKETLIQFSNKWDRLLSDSNSEKLNSPFFKRRQLNFDKNLKRRKNEDRYLSMTFPK